MLQLEIDWKNLITVITHLSTLKCCWLTETCLATSSIICSKILCAFPDKLAMPAESLDATKSFKSAQMYWKRLWSRTELRKSNRLTTSPKPLKPAISLERRRIIWQWGWGASSLELASSSEVLLENLPMRIYAIWNKCWFYLESRDWTIAPID